MCIHMTMESLENYKILYLSGCGCQIIKLVYLQNGVTCGWSSCKLLSDLGGVYG